MGGGGGGEGEDSRFFFFQASLLSGFANNSASFGGVLIYLLNLTIIPHNSEFLLVDTPTPFSSTSYFQLQILAFENELVA